MSRVRGITRESKLDPDAGLTSTDSAETARIVHAVNALLPSLERVTTQPPPDWYPAFLPDAEGDGSLPESGAGMETTLAELADLVERGCAISSPGFFGFITVGSTTTPAVAQLAASVAGGQRYLHHAFNHLEHLALSWLADLCGVPTEAAGVFTSGGSVANFVALGAARQSAYERMGIDVAENGSGNTPPGRIYASNRAHRTIHRSAAALGLGRQSVCEIPTDSTGRLDVKALSEAMDRDASEGVIPIATVAVAGTTDTGSIDPIDAVVDVARAHDSWVHVDGAYGLVAHASPALAPRFAGLERADSWIVDPHKWLSTGLGVGAVYVRDGAVLTRAFAEGAAAYLEGSFSKEAAVSQFDGMSGDWADQSIELSAPPRGALVWAVLREVGRAGIAARVERHVGLAKYLAGRVREHPRLELACEPELSIVCFRYIPPDDAESDKVNLQLLEALRRETATVPTSTVVGGRFCLRPCFINPRTTRAHVDALVTNTIKLGDRIVGR